MTLKELLDTVSALGTLGFALLAVFAFLTERIVPKGRLDEAYRLVETERAEKREALLLGRAAVASNERLADAVEVRNRLEEVREIAKREALRPPTRRPR